MSEPNAGPGPSPGQRPARAPMSGTDWALVALAIALVGAGAWFWLRRAQPTVPPPAPAVAAAAPAEAAAPPPAPAAAPVAPVAADRMKALMDAISPSALLRRWLGDADALERWAVVTDNLAEGASPRKALAFLEPSKPFTVADVGGATVIAPESYRRYDAIAEAVAAVDAKAAAQAYRALHEPVQAAYRALGYPGAALDDVTARALRRIAGAPVADREVVLVAAPEGAAWRFADPALEGLSAVEKHLLRMGPRNERLVQAKAKELLAALGMAAK